MANGRLGSAKVTPTSAALLYSNSSGSQAVINIQATSLSATSNANVAIAIDSSSVSLNQVTTDTAISSGNITQAIYNLDPLSNSVPLRHEYVSIAGGGSLRNVAFWNGSAWTNSGTVYGSTGQAQKIDPYFIRNPAAYGKTQADHVYGYRYNTGSGDVRLLLANVATMSGSGFANMQQYQDPSHSYGGSVHDSSYYGYGFSVCPYTNYTMGLGNYGWQGYARVGLSVDQSGTATSNGNVHQYGFSSNDPANYVHYWFAPRVLASKGIFMSQGTGFNGSYFFINDAELAVSLGNLSYAFTGGGSFSTMAWWLLQPTNASPYHIGWFEYNPNDEKYYFEYITGAQRGIYSFTRAGIQAGFATRGSSTAHGFATAIAAGIFTLVNGSPPWAPSYYITRPIRLDASLWWATTSQGTAYISTDLKNWSVATTYYASLGYPANTFNAAPLTTTSYKYAATGTANISRFTSGFANVSQTAVLEQGTSLSNYQRTGLLLSNGDKLYAQNYGSVDFSMTVMGYEG